MRGGGREGVNQVTGTHRGRGARISPFAYYNTFFLVLKKWGAGGGKWSTHREGVKTEKKVNYQFINFFC